MKEVQKIEDFIKRFRYQANKASLVQSRIKQLERWSGLSCRRSVSGSVSSSRMRPRAVGSCWSCRINPQLRQQSGAEQGWICVERPPTMVCRWRGRAPENLANKIKALTLFATHYFELTQLPEKWKASPTHLDALSTATPLPLCIACRMARRAKLRPGGCSSGGRAKRGD